MEGQRALGIHQKYLNLCSEDERRSYGFRTTCGWLIHDIIYIFGWTIHLREFKKIQKLLVPVVISKTPTTFTLSWQPVFWVWIESPRRSVSANRTLVSVVCLCSLSRSKVVKWVWKDGDLFQDHKVKWQFWVSSVSTPHNTFTSVNKSQQFVLDKHLGI